MKKQDVENFIKRLSGTSLVVSYNGRESYTVEGKCYLTHYFIVKSARWSKLRLKDTDAWTKEQALILDCSVTITDIKCVNSHTGKIFFDEPIIKFNNSKLIYTPELLDSLDMHSHATINNLEISKTNSLPEELKNRVKEMLRLKLTEAKNRLAAWDTTMLNHELFKAHEGLDD